MTLLKFFSNVREVGSLWRYTARRLTMRTTHMASSCVGLGLTIFETHLPFGAQNAEWFIWAEPFNIKQASVRRSRKQETRSGYIHENQMQSNFIGPFSVTLSNIGIRSRTLSPWERINSYTMLINKNRWSHLKINKKKMLYRSLRNHSYKITGRRIQSLAAPISLLWWLKYSSKPCETSEVQTTVSVRHGLVQFSSPLT
jgi:hypothetical protein